MRYLVTKQNEDGWEEKEIEADSMVEASSQILKEEGITIENKSISKED